MIQNGSDSKKDRERLSYRALHRLFPGLLAAEAAPMEPVDRISDDLAAEHLEASLTDIIRDNSHG